MRTCLALAVALNLAMPGAAFAGTVTAATTAFTIPDTSIRQTQTGVAFAAADGEANDVLVTPGDGGLVSVEDRGAPVTPGAGCHAVTPSKAVCDGTEQPPGPLSVTLALGDGADRSAGSGFRGFTVDGGDGDDTLSGSGDGVRLSGGPGADTLTGDPTTGSFVDGGAGADRLVGGSGGDVFTGDGPNDQPAHDEYVPGGGQDAVSYPGLEPVTVDLVAGVGGRPGEDESVVGMHDVRGGFGDNVLRGDDGPNRLVAPESLATALGLPTFAAGTEVLDGRGGTDQLLARVGGRSRLALTGGAGNDTLTVVAVTPGAVGTLDGGDGDDTLAGPVALDGGSGSDTLDGRARSCGAGRDVLRTVLVLLSFPADCERAHGPEVDVLTSRVGKTLRPLVDPAATSLGYRSLRVRVCLRAATCSVVLARGAAPLGATSPRVALTRTAAGRQATRRHDARATVFLELVRSDGTAEPALTYPGTLTR